MKKRSIVYLLAALLAFSPMAAFADTADSAPADADQAPAVEAVIPEAAEEAPAVIEEPEAEVISSEAAQEGEEWTKGWDKTDATRSQYKLDNGEIATGLFKAYKLNSEKYGLYYANSAGYLVKNTQFITINPGEKKYTYSGDGYDVDNSLLNSSVMYYIVARADGDCYIENVSQVIDNHFIKTDGTVQTTEGLINDGGKVRIVQNGGLIYTGTGIVPCAGKSYFVDNGIVYTTPGLRGGYLVGDGGAIVTAPGFVTLSNGLYYIQAGGAIAAGKEFTVGSSKYHATANGTIAIGNHKWGKYYYVSNGAGAVITKKGLYKFGGKCFYVQKGGKLKTNKKFKVKKAYYISDKTGTIHKGFFTWKKNLYYANSKFKLRTKAGFFKVSGQRFYSRKGGKIWRNKSFKVKGKTYRAYADGSIATYRYLWNNKYYYADKNGALRTKAGLFTYNNKQYYNKSGGGLASNEFVKNGDKYYYVGEGGAVVTKPFTYKGMTFTPNATTGEISKQDYIRVFPDAD